MKRRAAALSSTGLPLRWEPGGKQGCDSSKDSSSAAWLSQGLRYVGGKLWLGHPISCHGKRTCQVLLCRKHQWGIIVKSSHTTHCITSIDLLESGNIILQLVAKKGCLNIYSLLGEYAAETATAASKVKFSCKHLQIFLWPISLSFISQCMSEHTKFPSLFAYPASTEF